MEITTFPSSAAPLVTPAEPLVRMAPTMGLPEHDDRDVCYGTEFLSGTGPSRVALYFDTSIITPTVELGGCGEYTLDQMEAFLPHITALLNDPRVKAARRRAAAGLPPLLVEGKG